jgi:two-component system OmpR family sensor kinase
MKLMNKLSLWYLSLTLVVILIGGVFAYYQVKSEIDQAEIVRLQTLNDKIAEQIESGNRLNIQTNGRPVEIVALDSTIKENTSQIGEKSFFNPDIQHKECRLTVNSYYNINGEGYRISSYNYITKANEIFKGLLNSFIAILILLVILIAISARLASTKVLLPFNQTLDAIQSFQLKDKKRLELPKNTTKEFAELNSFLQEMTDKALDEYSSLKEFGENASHELQTPLAIIRTKIELLVESDINNEQAQLLGDIQKNIEKLSRINQSLTLLSKLENNEYSATENILFCKATKESLSSFEELIDMKSIELRKNIDKQIPVKFHPALADILLNNLISNAIRHNIQENGIIELTLTEKSLIIKNTGIEPNVPTEQLFQRFKKGNQCDNSIGIGLAIVKQICDLNNIHIAYIYSSGWHTLELKF